LTEAFQHKAKRTRKGRELQFRTQLVLGAADDLIAERFTRHPRRFRHCVAASNGFQCGLEKVWLDRGRGLISQAWYPEALVAAGRVTGADED
jgi:hypothetical protein